MDISIADQIALDDALVAPADRLKIGKCNLRLSSDVTSKEATLQVVYDVLKLTPFYKAFQVTADAPEIYMQEFWASAYVHNRSVRFKMNNKKHIIGLDQFRDILQICPKVGNKKFVEPPLEKEILIFLASLGHSGDIRKITDVNVNKLHQPWRSFAAIINKCLSGIPSYDSLRLSQAQILWGMYNKKNVDYAYLLWEDFIFKIENKNTKKGNAMYYPRFTKLVVNFVMEKDPSIPRRNKVNWHYARDDPMFTTINVISRNEESIDIQNIKGLTFWIRGENEINLDLSILDRSDANKMTQCTPTPTHAEYDESNTYVLERFNTSAGNPVKKILLKLNLSDHRLCKMVVECQSVKVKEFQERCNIKAFQEWYEHVGPEVASPQDGKVTRWRRDCAWLMISRCSRSQCQIQVQGTSSIQEVNDHYNIFTRESQEYELKTKDKA
ncbi:hypothetical protein Tco_0570781 [Tanacetum coccineum]